MNGEGERVCQWNVDCPQLKNCKSEMAWNGNKPTAQERSREAAIRRAKRDRGKAIGHAVRPLRIARDRETPPPIPDEQIPY